MITALRPIRMRANGYINTARMKPLGGEYVVDVIALLCAVMEIKGVIRFFPVLTRPVMVIETVKPALPKK